MTDLYSATIPQFVQILGAMSGLLAKAEAFCTEQKLVPEDIIGARLADDMLPFSYQIKSTAVHSAGAIAGARKGVFSPDLVPAPTTFAALNALVDATVSTLRAFDPADINQLAGQDMRFEMGELRLPFKGAEGFLLSFTLPNFHFHATAAYAILRATGVKLGKTDYLGRMLIAR